YATRLNPRSASLYHDLLQILSHSGHPERSILWRSLLESAFGDQPRLWLEWASLAELAGNFRDAYHALEHALPLLSGADQLDAKQRIDALKTRRGGAP